MRTRIPLVAIVLAVGVFFATASWAQLVPAVPRPAVAPVATPAVVAPQAVVPAPVATPAPALAPVPVGAASLVAPVTAAPVAAFAPVAAPAVLQPPPPQTPPPPAPAPPAPPQASKPPQPARPPAPPEAPPVPPDSPAANMNVRVEVTITDQSGSGAPTKKTVSLTVTDYGRGSVRSGVTGPIPSTTFGPAVSKEGDARPMTSYTYRDMGLSLDVTDTRIRGNYVRLRLAVEYNPVDEKMASAEAPGGMLAGQMPASFARFSQTLDLSLENGKPLVVASSSDPVPSRNRTATLEVKATILK